ncbi:MAG TPA: hypothetical protein VFO41_13780 [Alphaproteobacteria bacterium]|nr:hypothetical protein [Alphaproteobacteria bacterium]
MDDWNHSRADRLLSRFLGDNLQTATLWMVIWMGALALAGAIVFGLVGLMV